MSTEKKERPYIFPIEESWAALSVEEKAGVVSRATGMSPELSLESIRLAGEGGPEWSRFLYDVQIELAKQFNPNTKSWR